MGFKIEYTVGIIPLKIVKGIRVSDAESILELQEIVCDLVQSHTCNLSGKETYNLIVNIMYDIYNVVFKSESDVECAMKFNYHVCKIVQRHIKYKRVFKDSSLDTFKRNPIMPVLRHTYN